MGSGIFETVYEVNGGDFSNAGRASTSIKEALKHLGVPFAVVRRIAIASYEAEMNCVMHAEHGRMFLKVSPEAVTIEVVDKGPGIGDISLAMQEGYSTATPEMRELGFGAGMGLPNIKRNADTFEIASDVGKGTRLLIRVYQASWETRP
jgi:serine/threonine-protein kinase RsbT